MLSGIPKPIKENHQHMGEGHSDVSISMSRASSEDLKMEVQQIQHDKGAMKILAVAKRLEFIIQLIWPNSE
jgi:hypothetical protein